jgi:hypothetical protein
MLLLAAILYAYCLVLVTVMIGWPAFVVLVILVAVFISRKGRRLLTTLGSAAWATARELERAAMLGASP